MYINTHNTCYDEGDINIMPTYIEHIGSVPLRFLYFVCIVYKCKNSRHIWRVSEGYTHIVNNRCRFNSRLRDTSSHNKGKHISNQDECDSASPEGRGRITETSNQSTNIQAQQANKATLQIYKKIPFRGAHYRSVQYRPALSFKDTELLSEFT